MVGEFVGVGEIVGEAVAVGEQTTMHASSRNKYAPWTVAEQLVARPRMVMFWPAYGERSIGPQDCHGKTYH